MYTKAIEVVTTMKTTTKYINESITLPTFFHLKLKLANRKGNGIKSPRKIKEQTEKIGRKKKQKRKTKMKNVAFHPKKSYAEKTRTKSGRERA